MEIYQKKQVECVHFSSDKLHISSHAGVVFVERDGQKISLPLPKVNGAFLGLQKKRLLRRVLRLDKCNVLPCHEAAKIVVIWRGIVYQVDVVSGEWRETLRLKLCRNVLHQGVYQSGKTLVFGEYGANPHRKEVPIYASFDDGYSWTKVYVFAAGTLKHIHRVNYDPYEQVYWVTTGDFAGECRIVKLNREFQKIDELGDGSQLWRACQIFFKEDFVYWVMDSPFETSYAVKWCRRTQELTRLQAFPGPVCYTKEFANGWAVAATSVEKGAGVKDDFASLFASADLENWWPVARFLHDGLPKGVLKNGMLAFADGAQSPEAFWMFGEALLGLDGRCLNIGLIESSYVDISSGSQSKSQWIATKMLCAQVEDPVQKDLLLASVRSLEKVCDLLELHLKNEKEEPCSSFRVKGWDMIGLWNLVHSEDDRELHEWMRYCLLLKKERFIARIIKSDLAYNRFYVCAVGVVLLKSALLFKSAKANDFLLALRQQVLVQPPKHRFLAQNPVCTDAASAEMLLCSAIDAQMDAMAKFNKTGVGSKTE